MDTNIIKLRHLSREELRKIKRRRKRRKVIHYAAIMTALTLPIVAAYFIMAAIVSWGLGLAYCIVSPLVMLTLLVTFRGR
jgi:fatty acid desaturase